MAPKKPAETQEFGLRIGRRVVLRPVHVQDYPSLYAIAMAGENATRWRYRGATPSPEQFVRQMWDGVLVQYAVVGRQLGRLYGTVGLYNANLPSGYVYGYAMSAPDRMGSGKVVEGLLLMLEYAFRTWELRKVYFELPEFNLPQFQSAVGRYLVEEGRLIDHELLGGRRWDLVTLALYADVWHGPGKRLASGVIDGD